MNYCKYIHLKRFCFQKVSEILAGIFKMSCRQYKLHTLRDLELKAIASEGHSGRMITRLELQGAKSCSAVSVNGDTCDVREKLPVQFQPLFSCGRCVRCKLECHRFLFISRLPPGDFTSYFMQFHFTLLLKMDFD